VGLAQIAVAIQPANDLEIAFTENNTLIRLRTEKTRSAAIGVTWLDSGSTRFAHDQSEADISVDVTVRYGASWRLSFLYSVSRS
jgi:hypothetical protein